MRASTFAAIIALFGLFAGSARAQVPAQVGPEPKTQFLDQNGTPLAGGLVCTWAAGTATPQATYTDSSGNVANTNPVVLDSAGRANIWYSGSSYKVQLSGGGTCASPSNLQWTVDNFTVGLFAAGDITFTGNDTFTGTITFNGPIIINDGGSMNGTFTGNPNFTGIVSASQFQSTVATGTPPFIVASTTKVANLNVSAIDDCVVAGSPAANNVLQATSTTACAWSLVNHALDVANINGTAYPSGGAAHSVPVMTTASSAVTYKVIPTCAGSLTYSQSTDAFGCSLASGIQEASVAGCTTDAPPASVCGNTVTWPVAFADANYTAVCSGISSYTVPQTGGGFGVAGIADVRNYLAASVQVVTTNLNEGNIAAAFTTIKCIAIHP